ncbi:MAG: S-layer homology domain-containing protein [Oscillospiraceae bacterium]|jgi:hypothetical protein|nr:S-layer homology domain-containing protein [Oscillospiraceae bacterium]
MKKQRKALSLLLSLTMVFSLFAGMLVSAKAADPVVLTVYAQNGSAGQPIKVKEYTAAKLEAIATEGQYTYNSGSGGIVEALKYVELDDLITNAGIADKWVEASTLKIQAIDNYAQSYTKAQIDAGNYYHPASGAPELVPAVFALETAVTSNDPRILFGRPFDLPDGGNGIYKGGSRLAKTVNRLTVIYPESPVLYVYSQEEGSASVLAKSYKAAELAALKQDYASGLGYQFYKGTAWQGVVATNLVSLDTLLANAGIADKWVDGAALDTVGIDGYKVSSTYTVITAGKYYIDEAGKTEVPSGIAINWWSGGLDDTIANLAANAYDSGSLRFVFGITEAQYTGQNAAGSRLANMVETLTVVYPKTADPADPEDPDKPGPKPEMKFDDVKPGDWFYSFVEYAFQNGIVAGKSATTFAPGDKTTRAEFVQMLYGLAGKPAATVKHPFTDAAVVWYQDAFNWAYENKIVSGLSATEFGPGNPITREQIAVILRNYKGAAAGDASVLAKFEDAGEVSGWATGAFAWAVASNLITGRSATVAAPLADATRAEVVTLLYKLSLL